MPPPEALYDHGLRFIYVSSQVLDVVRVRVNSYKSHAFREWKVRIVQIILGLRTPRPATEARDHEMPGPGIFHEKMQKKYTPARNSGPPLWHFSAIFRGIRSGSQNFRPGVFLRYFSWKFRVRPTWVSVSIAGRGALNSWQALDDSLPLKDIRAELQATDLRWQSPICGFLQFSLKILGFCANLFWGVPAPSTCLNFQGKGWVRKNLRFSAKICVLGSLSP